MMRRSAVRRSSPSVVGTVARTAAIAGTATVVAKGVSGSMDAKAHQAQQEQAAKAQQQADMLAMQQQLASLQSQQAQAMAAPPPVVAQPVAAPAAPAPVPAAAGGTDLIAQLQQLGDLKTAGLLSDAEFEAAKARVLGT